MKQSAIKFTRINVRIFLSVFGFRRQSCCALLCHAASVVVPLRAFDVR